MDRAQIVLTAMLPVLLVASAFASASETALFGVTPGELARLRRVSPAAASAVERLRAMPTRLLGQVLLINMVANTAYFIASSVLTVRAESAATKVGISVGSVLAVVLFGEVLAKLFASATRVRFLQLAAPLHLAIRGGLSWFLAGFDRFVIAPLSRLVVPRVSEPAPISPDELAELIALSAAEGAFKGSEQGLLRSIVTLGSIRVREVMRPRRDLVFVERIAPVEEIVRVCAESGHARVPVCESGLDGEVVGVLDTTRLLAGEPLSRAMTRPRFVPELARLDTLLERFRVEGVGAAVCVNEYGGVVGLVTISDVVDELVMSSIDDEVGAEDGVTRTGQRTWQVPGRLGVRELGDAFGVKDVAVRSGRATTIAGVVMFLLGRMPVPGDEAELGDLRLRVLEVENRSVRRVEVTLKERTP